MSNKDNTIIAQQLLHDVFEYRDGNLYWKIKPTNNSKVKIGDIAGCLRNDGYLRVGLLRKQYATHRLIYLMHHGVLPKYIDHADGNKLNNKIENLREASSEENNRNRSLCKRNTSGHKGVTWHKQHKKWMAQLSIDRKNKFLGYFDDIELAIKKVKEYRILEHKEFTNHGE